MIKKVHIPVILRMSLTEAGAVGKRAMQVLVSSAIALGVLGLSLPSFAADTARSDTSPNFLGDVFSFYLSYRPQIDLGGNWEFRGDKAREGLGQGWHEGKGEFKTSINIPGAPQAQGIGEPCDIMKTYFADPFWVRRRFVPPTLDPGSRLWLRIGGILPTADIYLNGKHVGYTQSSRTQQRVDVTDFIQPGGENLLAVYVSGQAYSDPELAYPRPRLDGMYEWPGLGPLWTGVYRQMFLEITGPNPILDTYVEPQLASHNAHVEVDFLAPLSEQTLAKLEVLDGKKGVVKTTVMLAPGEKHFDVNVPMVKFTAWSPDTPKLYTLTVTLSSEKGERFLDKVGVRFGMRELITRDGKFILNGKPLLLRCFGDMDLYVNTICPPADKNWFLPKLKLARSYGMNAVKGCIEPRSLDYLEAADEAGLIVIQEFPFGVTGPIRSNREKILDSFRQFNSKELEGMVRQYRSHASTLIYSMASEMTFSAMTADTLKYWSREMPERVRQLSRNGLVIDCTGSWGTPNTLDTPVGQRGTDVYTHGLYKEVFEEPNIVTDGKQPMILHEWNWWGSYPSLAAKPKYDSTQIRPVWLEVLEKTAKAKGQLDLVETYYKNSQWLQALSRKDGIEYVRRSRNIEGYILWLLTDYHKWSEGLLDDFWQPKTVSPTEYLKSNGDTVAVLAREGERCFRAGDKVSIPLAIDHYGQQVLRGCTLKWRARQEHGFAKGQLKLPDLPLGELTQAGQVVFVLPKAEQGYKFELEVEIRDGLHSINSNNWSFWAFPEVEESFSSAGLPLSAGKRVAGAYIRTGVVADKPVPEGLDFINSNYGSFWAFPEVEESFSAAGSPLSAGKRVAGAYLCTGVAADKPVPDGTKLVLADTVDASLADYIENGGTCVMFTNNAVIENRVYFDIGTKMIAYNLFRAAYWSGGPANYGTVITPHPAMEDFPYESMCDLQFFSMIHGSFPMEFSPLQKYKVTPIIRGIGWFRENPNNAYLIEFKVGKGRVLACSLGVLQACQEHIEARNLLSSLLKYAGGTRFQPTAVVPREDFVRLFARRTE